MSDSGLKGLKICRVATVSYYLVSQLKAQAEFLRDLGMVVVLISSDGPELAGLKLGNNLSHEVVRIERAIRPFQDITALFKLIRLFRRYRFDIVHSTTPKAGLLAAIAGFLAAVPVTLHTFTGQQWVTMQGPLRWISRLADRIIGLLCTRCYTDSASQRRFLIQEGIIAATSIDVIGDGSLAGVDIKRFNPRRWSAEDKERLRAELTIPPGARVFIFIGRLTRDKGVYELLAAFDRLHLLGYDADLLLLGPLDQDCGGRNSLDREEIGSRPRVHYQGYVENPEKYLAVSDVLCLPSYREGFGTVVIEAAAMGLPTLGTQINGLSDAVVQGETGVLVPPQDEGALFAEMRKFLDIPGRIEEMGKAASERCRRLFDSRVINRKLAKEYQAVVGERLK